MGNLSQHIQWSAMILSYLLIGLIYLLLGDVILVLLPVPIFFIIGAVMPDIDLSTDKKWRKLIFYITVPIIGPYINKRATHWGRVHSIGFCMIYGIMMLDLLIMCQLSLSYSFILSLSFAIGFLSHLVCDQFYHTIRGKKGKRVALKLWSNEWTYDPLVFIFRRL